MAAAPVEIVKPTNSLPQLPSVKTPRFTGGKLASIRRKIDEKQLLLDGGIPPQLLKHTEFEIASELLREEEAEEAHASSPSCEVSGGDASRKDEKDLQGNEKDTKSVLCTLCGRSFAEDRMLVHQEVCKISVERSSQIPFIVKLGLTRVDGEKDKDLMESTPGKEECVKVKVTETENAEKGVDKDEEKGNEYSQEGEEEDEEEKEEDVDFLHLEIPKISPAVTQFPGGGFNWTEEHARYMRHLEKAKQAMQQFALGNFPNLPPPPGPNELETEYVQCPHCLGRFTENYNAFDHLTKCSRNIQNRNLFNPMTNPSKINRK